MNKFLKACMRADALSVFEINATIYSVACGIGFAKFEASLVQ